MWSVAPRSHNPRVSKYYMRHPYKKHYLREQESTIQRVSQVFPVGLSIFLSPQYRILLPLLILDQTGHLIKRKQQ